MALTVISGVVPRTSLETSREKLNIMDRIFLLAPTKHPATLVTQAIRRFRSDNVMFSWYNKKTVPYEFTINGAVSSTSEATLVLDSTAGLVEGDILENRTATSHEHYLIYDVTSATDLEVIRNYGSGEGWTTRAQYIGDNDVLWRIGNAYEQDWPIVDIVSTQEDLTTNYCQMFRTAMGMSHEVIDSALHGEPQWPLEQRAKILEHHLGPEMSFFFGLPYVGDKGLGSGTHTSGDLPATTGGINNFLIENGNSDILIDDDDMSMFEFMDHLEALFDKGSGEKVCYCPPLLRTGLEKWGIVKQQTFSRDERMGVPINTWDSAHGIVHFITHELMKAPSTSTYSYSFFVDYGQDQIGLVEFGRYGLGTLGPVLGYKERNGATGDKQEILSQVGARFGCMDLHGRLRFKTVSV